MSSKEARRRLRQAGFQEVRNGGKHLIMEKPAAEPGRPPLRVIVPSGDHMSRRSEAGIMRLVAGRATLLERQGHRNVGDVRA